MAFKSAKCWACHRHRPVQSHHVHILEYGAAKDSEQVLICADCHSIVHKEGEHYAKTGKFQDLDRTIPHTTPDGYGYRLRELIAKLVLAKRQFETGDSQDSDEQRRMTQISWDSDAELRMAHAVKTAMKFKSLPRAMKHLVFEKYQELQRR